MKLASIAPPITFAAALALLPYLSSAADRPYYASAWIEAGQARPVPQSKYAGADWRKLLTDVGETELQAPPGGRSYRAMVDDYEIGLGLFVIRLDVAADGKATLTSSYRGRRPRVLPLTASALAEFDAALAKSKIETTGAPVGVCDNGDETLFEAVVKARYKLVIQPCADEAGLTKAVEILRSNS